MSRPITEKVAECVRHWALKLKVFLSSAEKTKVNNTEMQTNYRNSSSVCKTSNLRAQGSRFKCHGGCHYFFESRARKTKVSETEVQVNIIKSSSVCKTSNLRACGCWFKSRGSKSNWTWTFYNLLVIRPLRSETFFHHSDLSYLIQLLLAVAPLTDHCSNSYLHWTWSDSLFYTDLFWLFQIQTITSETNLSANRTCEGNREGDICRFIYLTNDCGCKSEICVLTRLSAELDAFNGRHVEDSVPDSSQHLEASCVPRVVLILHGRWNRRFTSTGGLLQTERGRLETAGLPHSHQGQSVLPDPPCYS